MVIPEVLSKLAEKQLLYGSQRLTGLSLGGRVQ